MVKGVNFLGQSSEFALFACKLFVFTRNVDRKYFSRMLLYKALLRNHKGSARPQVEALRFHAGHGIKTSWRHYQAKWKLVCEAIGNAATPGLLCQPRVIVKMIVEKQMECTVDWQGKQKFSEKPCPGATFVHHKIPHDQTRVWTGAAEVGSRWLTAWPMARPQFMP
jgi:hypothetical protein